MNETELLQAFYEDITASRSIYPKYTAGWYLEQLEEPYRTQALENIINCEGDCTFSGNPEALVGDNTYIAYVIQRAFDWGRSPQGVEYWKNLYMRLATEKR
jgi:hypothetical protein